jgi:hypothetical protein
MEERYKKCSEWHLHIVCYMSISCVYIQWILWYIHVFCPLQGLSLLYEPKIRSFEVSPRFRTSAKQKVRNTFPFNIIFKHPVALIDYLVFIFSLSNATVINVSMYVYWLPYCLISFTYCVIHTTCFSLTWPSSGISDIVSCFTVWLPIEGSTN